MANSGATGDHDDQAGTSTEYHHGEARTFSEYGIDQLEDPSALTT
jgi:hypothetical protein